jgi:hypothetical protein
MSGDILINMDQTHVHVSISVNIDDKSYDLTESMAAIASTLKNNDNE